MAPFRCLNVTAILASFAKHKSVGGVSDESRRSALAFVLREFVASSEKSLLRHSSQPFGDPSSSTRGVVALKLRRVASESGQTPKDVLSSSFEKFRRAASTKKSKRMSWRFARTTRAGECVSGRTVEDEWAWRSIGDIAMTILRERAVPRVTKPTGKLQ